MGRLVHLVAGRSTITNELLVGALHERGVAARRTPPDALACVAADDVVLGRLDVRRTLDGVEAGIPELERLQQTTVRVLNPAQALLACHDKLHTALALVRAGLPHPETAHVDAAAPPPQLRFPVVVKPRFGSWGADVVRCESSQQLRRSLRRLEGRGWFERHGALVQELIPPAGFDLRLVVAADRVIGAIERHAAPGEWRTNVALGGSRRPVRPPAAACALALGAAAAVGGDLVGVDLLPTPDGDFVVLELNGAVDFTAAYSQPGRDVFDDAAAALAHVAAATAATAAGHSRSAY